MAYFLFILLFIFILICLFIISYYIDFNRIEENLKYAKKRGYMSTINFINGYSNNSVVYSFQNVDLASKYPNARVSVRIEDIGNTVCKRFINLEKIISYAHQKGVFIWISSGHLNMRDEELNAYMYMHSKYNNVGLTIACYHPNSELYVKKVLALRGKIRLVKGYYTDGTLSNKETIDKYIYCALLLLESGYDGHEFASHDFKVLDKVLDHHNIYNITIGIYFLNKKYVLNKLEERCINYRVSFYSSYGSMYSLAKILLFK
jgi:cell division protein FtsI/penicillin-binding protein 2